ncbi:MAG: HlyD family secretion protein [Gemmatimonadota bacterium]
MTHRKRLLIGLAVVVALALLVVWLLRRGGEEDAIAASGTVEATEADLGFGIPGRIAEVGVDEGDSVVAGQELAVLDLDEAVARRDQAVAGAEAAEALLTELERGSRPEEITQAGATLDAASQALDAAELDLGRTRTLYEAGGASGEALDRAETRFAAARAERTRAAEQLELALEGPRIERVAAQRANVAQARAGVEEAATLLRDGTVRAPFRGTVTIRHREPGETVAAGAPVVSVIDLDDRWVRIYVPEDQIGRVRIGQPAEITADTYPDRTYEGEVVFIASEAEFTPSNVQTKEERVRLVYEVKVRVTGDPRYELKVGTPADVRLAGGAGDEG